MAKMCDMCGKRPATTFTSYTINGVTTKTCLCSECAKKYDIASNFSAENIIASVFGEPEGIRKRSRRLRQCPICGATEEDIINNNEFGCSECYKTFVDIAEAFTRRMGQGAHIGKIPYRTSNSEFNTDGEKVKNVDNEPREELSELDKLKRELKLAVDEERYDDASRLKKEIDRLKSKKEGE